MSQPRIAIIGAGLSGVGAARTLLKAGCKTVVFEKSRGFGGRCATKTWEKDKVDHGAQFFTTRSSDFARAVRTACARDILHVAAPVLSERGTPLGSEKRYYHAEGNSRLARALAQGLEVRLESPVQDPRLVDRQWRLGGETFDAVLSTAPLPQTLALFSIPPAPEEERPAAQHVPCLALLLRYWGEWIGVTREHYAVSDRSGHPLAWSACENHKAGRIQPGRTVMVVHASAAFSTQYLEQPPEVWAPLLRHELEARWALPAAHFAEWLPHRWRHARVEAPGFVPPLPERVWYAGDGAAESRVESAWMHGVAVAEQMLGSFGIAPPKR